METRLGSWKVTVETTGDAKSWSLTVCLNSCTGNLRASVKLAAVTRTAFLPSHVIPPFIMELRFLSTPLI